MTQETHYCSICGKSNHEVSDMAVMGNKALCSECVSITAGVFLAKGSAVFKKNIELLSSVASAFEVKTVGIDVQDKNIVAAEALHRQCCGMDSKVDFEQILKQRRREDEVSQQEELADDQAADEFDSSPDLLLVSSVVLKVVKAGLERQRVQPSVDNIRCVLSLIDGSLPAFTF
ncbi:hypothetical protein JHW33_03185 [Rahnella aceris]|uniref:ClpX C4-type zinc finger protein n=1 Tax=Rahnella sp. (strain Y9602) TaxID=2703885 RepID=UPI0019046C56|nr:ClpX C4-type zinc finger protein [Rahnella aceris]QQN35663.1 hypothetical protein JHW33_03185 [Rahnella aceris]